MKTILILSLFFSLPLYGNEKAPAEAKPKESKASKDLKFRENAFLEIDTDDDDIITQEEFFAFMLILFNYNDKNGDGGYDVTELKNPQLIKRLDLDEDGKVSLEEDRVLRMGHFKLHDQNEDGELSWVEYVYIE